MLNAKQPLPSPLPVKSFLKSVPKVHLVAVEENIQSSIALDQNHAQDAVNNLFQSL